MTTTKTYFALVDFSTIVALSTFTIVPAAEFD
jgi:hypothetical protein